MRDERNFHLKIQELCDCFATNDPIVEMGDVQKEDDQQEAALKWMALAVLHGVTASAEKISVTKTEDGNIEVTAKYKKSPLPNPGPTVGQNLIDAVREIIHIEEGKGKMPLSLGIRNDSVQLQVKVKNKDGREKVSIKFPD